MILIAYLAQLGALLEKKPTHNRVGDPGDFDWDGGWCRKLIGFVFDTLDGSFEGNDGGGKYDVRVPCSRPILYVRKEWGVGENWRVLVREVARMS